MSKSVNRIISVMLAIFAVLTMFTVIPPVKASASSIISYDVNYAGKYVLLSLVPKSSSNVIRYTTNGAKPTTKSTRYTSTLAAEKKTVVRAAEYNKSGKKVATIKLTIKPRVETPEMTVIYRNGLTYVSIRTETPDAAIYYTTNGSEPTKSSPQYSDGIMCAAGMTIKARAYKSGMKASLVVTYSVPSGKSAEMPIDEVVYDVDDIAAVHDLVNNERRQAGLSSLALDPDLCTVAYIRAVEISQRFSHYRPDGRDCFTAIDEAGIYYFAAAENIAEGQRTAASVMNSWMNSSGHRSNILSDRFGRIGIGVFTLSGRRYWVQVFTN